MKGRRRFVVMDMGFDVSGSLQIQKVFQAFSGSILDVHAHSDLREAATTKKLFERWLKMLRSGPTHPRHGDLDAIPFLAFNVAAERSSEAVCQWLVVEHGYLITDEHGFLMAAKERKEHKKLKC